MDGDASTALIYMLRLTAMSYLVGLADGLPVGLQVIGRSGDAANVLSVGRLLERVGPWTSRPNMSKMAS